MNKKIMIIPIIAIVIISLIGISLDIDKASIEDANEVLFHITLADPSLYSNGVYTETFTINKGEYSFRFVPNGSSPKILSISLEA